MEPSIIEMGLLAIGVEVLGTFDLIAYQIYNVGSLIR